ncbi:tetratricopeptide repeat protein SKI3 isoform X1 [Primulina huaijiensis]|uniref:tetratricopeptide repeat protein SKI3 isoform X1 n=3 Tax=Primulina huaijiensis TaxID=1492673 RepID=UPI003CC7857F
MLLEKEESVSVKQLEEEYMESESESLPADPSLHFNLGVSLWEKGEESQDIRGKAVEHFMMAVKLNPQNGDAFRYLGHYYAHDSPMPLRALKCYQRAVFLNPDDSCAGEAICDMLDKEGKESLVFAVCCEASEKSARAFWAFRQLGYLQANQKKWSEAVHNLQHAIRGFPTCADLWETLGLAYHRMGMLTAALKSYGRAIELEESRVFAWIESGNISLMLGSFRNGVEQFRNALRMSPHNVSAHFGLASALLGFAKECTNLGAFGWGAILLEEASAVATHGTSLASNVSCLWKLHGDIQLTYARCFPWTEEGLADETAFSSSISSWRRTCFLAASHASHFYQRALCLTPWQANIYADVAIASDLISSLKVNPEEHQPVWPLAEKMCLGSILLEGHNEEFWVALGCLSDDIALKQHAFIRGLQLDISLAVAWAYIGKLYRREGELQLAQQAFDRARSIDPSLALPWAGMSADAEARNLNENEAYECCLRAVQIFPLAEFQIGLAKLALNSGQLSSSEVFGAIKQALMRAPEYPESHNLNGLACESKSDYENAITSYKLARCALKSFAAESAEPCLKDISINLARSLCMAGHAEDAVEECEYLRQKGQLSHEGLQVYALCLWKLNRYDMALSIARELGSRILTAEKNMAAASISFICRLLYYISGPESAITSILKMPKEFFNSSKISFIVYAMHALDQKDQLDSVVSLSRACVTSHEEIIAMHLLISLGKLVKHQQKDCLAIHKSARHLRKALHMYPNSSVLRNLLGSLLLSSKEWRDLGLATRCPIIDLSDHHKKDEGMKSACEIIGAGTVACFDTKNGNENFAALTCRHQLPFQSGIIKLLQKFLHQEPWNFNARYLLTVNYLQKARESRFPPHICRVLARLTAVALSHQLCLSKYMCLQYQYFQLLLCSAELDLQQGNTGECIEHARSALGVSVDNSCLFFAHLLLCRAYAAENDIVSMSKEYRQCLELKTDFHIGWICLKFIESRYKLQNDLGISNLSFEDCFKDMELSWNMWMGIFNMVEGLSAIWFGDFVAAEEFLAQACDVAESEIFLFLCHGAICLELARQKFEAQYISCAIRSLTKAKEISPGPLPIISLLLAQAEASLGSKAKWENNLHDEWLSWPSEMRPAELLFQMHLLSRQLKDCSESSSIRDSGGSSLKWMLRAIHVNPSCLRYWKLLQKEHLH